MRNPFVPGAYWNTGVAPRTPIRPVRNDSRSHPMLPGAYWNTGVAPRTPVRPVNPSMRSSHPMLPGAYWNTGVAPKTPVRPVMRDMTRDGFVKPSPTNPNPIYPTAREHHPWALIGVDNIRRTAQPNQGGEIPFDSIAKTRGTGMRPTQYGPRGGRMNFAKPLDYDPGAWYRNADGMDDFTQDQVIDVASQFGSFMNLDGDEGSEIYRGADTRDVQNARPPHPGWFKNEPRDVQNTRPYGDIYKNSQNAQPFDFDELTTHRTMPPQTPSNMLNTAPEMSMEGDAHRFDGTNSVYRNENASPFGFLTENQRTAARDVQNARPPVTWINRTNTRPTDKVDNTLYASGTQPSYSPPDVRNTGPGQDIGTACSPIDRSRAELGNYCPEDYPERKAMKPYATGATPVDKLNAPPHILRPYDKVAPPPNRMDPDVPLPFQPFDGEDEDGGCPEGMYFCPIDGICKHDTSQFNQKLWINE